MINKGLRRKLPASNGAIWHIILILISLGKFIHGYPELYSFILVA